MAIFNAGTGLAGLGIVAYPAEVNRSLTGFQGYQGGGLGSAIAHSYGLGSPIAHTYGLGAPIAHTYGLGNTPSDEDLSRYRDTWYQGVHHGWINGKNRFYGGGNLGNTSTAVRGILGLEAGDKALEDIAKSEKIKAGMAIVSAIAVSTVALITVFGFVKGR
jgi:hypothetical protein